MDNLVSCGNCWNADRDPDTGARQIIEETDATAQISQVGGNLPTVRVVKSCGVGMTYYKTYGATGHHSCKKFYDAQICIDEAQAAVEEAAADFELETTRTKLPDNANSLLHIELMSEEDPTAFDALLQAMTEGMGIFTDVVLNLDDMNIRGEQLAWAFTFADNDITTLQGLAVERDPAMIKYVNKAVPPSEKGPAVERFASEFGHHAKMPPSTHTLKIKRRPRKRLLRR